jgi:LacI family transcriptional regulator
VAGVTALAKVHCVRPDAGVVISSIRFKHWGADGVVCTEDYTVVGVMLELLRRGISVPRKVSVVGFNNLPIGDSFSVGVTTYSYPSEEVAEQAFRMMRHRLEHPEAVPVKVIVPGQLIIRDSSDPHGGRD